MKKTHKGSCHCGAVRFEADIDLDDVEPAEWSRMPVAYADGRHNNWRSPPAETSYL